MTNYTLKPSPLTTPVDIKINLKTMRVSPRQLSGGFKEVRDASNNYNISDTQQCGFCFFLLPWRLCGFHFLNGVSVLDNLGFDAGGNAEVDFLAILI